MILMLLQPRHGGRDIKPVAVGADEGEGRERLCGWMGLLAMAGQEQLVRVEQNNVKLMGVRVFNPI